MAETHFSGPLILTGDPNNAVVNPAQPSAAFFQGGEQTDVDTFGSFALPIVGNIADSTSTTIGHIYIPNPPAGSPITLVANLMVRVSITAASHIYDSTRVTQYTLTLVRQNGGATVAQLSSAANSQIATVSGGRTVTSTLSLASVSGGNTAAQSIAIQVNNVSSTAGITETAIAFEILSGGFANGPYIAV